MEKVWANKVSNQKEVGMIHCFLFGVDVHNPDEPGCCPARAAGCPGPEFSFSLIKNGQL